MALGQGVYFRFIQQKRSAGFEGERADVGGGAGFQSSRAEARNIKAQIVAGLWDFDGYCAFGQFAAACQTGIGALKAFNSKDSSVFDDHGLANFKSAGFARDA